MVADPLSRLQSDHIDESYLHEGILECYVKYFEGIFLVDIVKHSKNNAIRKRTIDDFIKEQN